MKITLLELLDIISFGNSGDHEVPVAQQRTEPKCLGLHDAPSGDTAL
jgi:hypothetical protein